MVVIAAAGLSVPGIAQQAPVKDTTFTSAKANIDSNGSNPTGDLIVTFKEVNVTGFENYQVDATALVYYVCVDDATGTCVANTEQAVGPAASATFVCPFTASNNGSNTGTCTLQPPAATVACGSGQTAQLESATYSDISITDGTSLVVSTSPISISATVFSCTPGGGSHGKKH